MSIESQINEMETLAKKDKLEIVFIKKESHSAKQSGMRPVYNEMLQELRAGKFNGILTWAPDRLSRNAGDLGSLVDLMDLNKLKHIRTYGQIFNNSPNEKFLLMILCSQAKSENDNRGINVKRGIRAKCELGWRPCMPPIGYYNRTMAGLKDTIVDPDRGRIITEMFELVANGHSGRYIQRWFESMNFTSRSSNHISLSMIYMMLKNPFYYGQFEYPKNSGKWYKGAHTPLITEETFDIVQQRVKLIEGRSKWGSKSFPYKGAATCYDCGSSIVGEEKYKTLKNGRSNRHVYYHCSRQVDLNCKQPYIKEDKLIEEFIAIINKIGIDLAIADEGLVKDIARTRNLMKQTNPVVSQKAALDAYVKFVFEDGSDFEKTRLVRNIQPKLTLKERNLVFS